MLVVSSEVGETIIIDGEIYITVLQNKSTGINVAIDAPSNVSVDTLKAFHWKKSSSSRLVNKDRK